MTEGIEEVLHEREVGIEILMLGATFGSAALGMWDEAAFLVFLYGIAEGVEEFTYAKTRHSIRKLLDLAPKEARLLKNGDEVIIPAEQLAVGSVFLVKPGEAIATDGVIMKGISHINEAPVTGESMPVEKRTGMKVFAGTINHEGVLEIRATASCKDNTLAKMIHMVEEAQERKGKTQLFIDRFGRIYSPLVLIGSAIIMLIPWLFNLPPSEWTIRAVVFLVAAAPCALIMSTPVAIAAGIGRAGFHGILIKGGVHLENIGKIKTIAFDKTGTLTKGRPVVTDIISFKGDETEVLTIAYSIEKLAAHPLATAIVEYAEQKGLKARECSGFKSVFGAGAQATIDGKVFYVGKQDMFSRPSGTPSSPAVVEALHKEGKIAFVVGDETEIYGVIALKDEIRPQAKEVIQQLANKGIKVVMLSGDNAVVAASVANDLGIRDVRAELEPEDKIKNIEDMETRSGAVAMIGDGINDAPALAKASVGIAMGVAGSDAAIEAANVALMADDLSKIIYLLDLGKKAKKISSQNIVFSIIVLIIMIPLALAGLMSVAQAVVIHEVSEILAVLNGLRVAREDA